MKNKFAAGIVASTLSLSTSFGTEAQASDFGDFSRTLRDVGRVMRDVEDLSRGADRLMNGGRRGYDAPRYYNPGREYADEADRCNVPYYRSNGNVGGTINVCTDHGRRQMQGGARGYDEPRYREQAPREFSCKDKYGNRYVSEAPCPRR
ncbi:MAG: hypothetical protein DI626_06150 [Micavibrio aeruginosavorus]|uniref:Uncharacterized protein n=1 Tax=Micavibrio aeruginosavorus TaxID=349221 RepID=A0A2W4ZZP8_9BACT|nr:MAG: hypothetical protein DI626_06150 [Micavibrio aeruginosavorus]